MASSKSILSLFFSSTCFLISYSIFSFSRGASLLSIVFLPTNLNFGLFFSGGDLLVVESKSDNDILASCFSFFVADLMSGLRAIISSDFESEISSFSYSVFLSLETNYISISLFCDIGIAAAGSICEGTNKLSPRTSCKSSSFISASSSASWDSRTSVSFVGLHKSIES